MFIDNAPLHDTLAKWQKKFLSSLSNNMMQMINSK